MAIALGVAVMALISLAALVDPFAWLPPVAEVWEDCEGECELETRFPGFWFHAVVNLVWTVAACAAVLALGGAVADLRSARRDRYETAGAWERWLDARRALRWAALTAGALACLPLLAAVL